MRLPLASLLALAPVLVCACGTAGASASAEATGTATAAVTADGGTPEYIDITAYATSHGELIDYESVIQAMNAEFNGQCNGSYCTGQYPNLTPLAFDCSVSHVEGDIRKCFYVFGGSYQTIEGSSGEVTVHTQTFSCDIIMKGNVKELIAALATGPSPLTNPLPGGTRSVTDWLTDCLP